MSKFIIAVVVGVICLAIGAYSAPAQEVETGVRFKRHELCGIWEYQSAYVQLPSGAITYNFGQSPRGLFIIDCKTRRYEHIVMSSDLPQIASGALQTPTDAEARAVATGVLAHFGRWTAEPRAGRFTVKIEKSSFANFDGIDQVRVVQVLNRNILQYKNLQVSNGAGAVVVAVLRRIRHR